MPKKIIEKYLLPGLKPVLDLLSDKPSAIAQVFCKKDLPDRELQKIIALCQQTSTSLSLLEAAALQKLCIAAGMGKVAHQGIVAELYELEFCSLDFILSSLPEYPLPVIVALDQIRDPGNAGTLCRTIFALGGCGIIVPKHNSSFWGAGAMKASGGTAARLPIAQVTNLAHALDRADELGITIYGTSVSEKESDSIINAFTLKPDMPAIIVLGSESSGIRPGVAKRCAHNIFIPMSRNFNSLNVAQAGAILLALFARFWSTKTS